MGNNTNIKKINFFDKLSYIASTISIVSFFLGANMICIYTAIFVLFKSALDGITYLCNKFIGGK